MVGFPTETREDFQKTLDLLDELKFDWVEVYSFTPRLGTPAAKMDGQITDKIKKLRLRKLTFKAKTRYPFKRIKQILLSYLN